jgi:hypothetical protein
MACREAAVDEVVEADREGDQEPELRNGACVTREHALMLLRQYVLHYTRNKLGEPAPEASTRLALEALETLEREDVHCGGAR